MIVPDWLIAEVLEHIKWDRLSIPILTPDNPPVLEEEIDWGEHQTYLKVLAYINQNGVCLCEKMILAGQPSDLHHALVTRKDVQGTKQKELIHHSHNVLLLHRPCHIEVTRKKSKEFLITIYGEEQIENWLKSLPYKIAY